MAVAIDGNCDLWRWRLTAIVIDAVAIAGSSDGTADATSAVVIYYDCSRWAAVALDVNCD